MSIISWSFPLVCEIHIIKKKKGLGLLFTFDLRACDRCVDLDVELDPDSTVRRFFFSSSFFSALNFLFFSLLFFSQAQTRARGWYNWLHRQPTDVSSFQLLQSIQMLRLYHLQTGAHYALFSRWPWRSHRPASWRFLFLIEFSAFSNFHLSANVKMEGGGGLFMFWGLKDLYMRTYIYIGWLYVFLFSS